MPRTHHGHLGVQALPHLHTTVRHQHRPVQVDVHEGAGLEAGRGVREENQD